MQQKIEQVKAIYQRPAEPHKPATQPNCCNAFQGAANPKLVLELPKLERNPQAEMAQKLSQIKTVQETSTHYAFLPDVPQLLVARTDDAAHAQPVANLDELVGRLTADYDAVEAQQRRLIGQEVEAQLAAEFAAAADKLALENAGRCDATPVLSY